MPWQSNMTKKETCSYLLYFPQGISRLEKFGELFYFPKNHLLVEQGNYTKYCYVVKKGRVISCEILPNGEERIYHFFEDNAIFLEAEVMFDRPSSLNFKTTETTEVIRIEKRTLLNEMKKDSQLALDMMESVFNMYASTMEQVRQTKSQKLSWKMCDLFLSFAEHYGIMAGSEVMITEKFSQQTIANMLGINRVTAVRVIKKMKDENILEQRKGFYYIKDMERLKRYQTGE